MDVNIAGIVHDSIVDGPGLRTVIFFQGCSHNCDGCHNTDTHSQKINKLMSIENVINEVKSNPLSKRITISGGEPFLQYQQLLELCKIFKDYQIWIYTGYTYNQLISLGFDKIFKYIDAIVDGPFIKDQKTLNIPYIGSTNQNIIKF